MTTRPVSMRVRLAPPGRTAKTCAARKCPVRRSPSSRSASSARIDVRRLRPNMSANFSCYGEKTIRTPHVDRLAEEGTRFTKAFVTAPVCSPCRSALITGCYQTTIGAHHHRIGRGAMMIRQIDIVMFGDRFELVVHDVGQQLAREPHRAQAWICKTILRKHESHFVIQEPHIEGRIMRDKHCVPQKAEQVMGDVGKRRGVANHLVIDARQLRDERRDRHLRIDQRMEFAGDLTVAHAICPDLSHARRRRPDTGRLEIEHDKLGIGQFAFLRAAGLEDDAIAVERQPRIAIDQFGHEQPGH